MAEARAIVMALAALEPAHIGTNPAEGDFTHISDEQGREIARMFEGDFGLFRELDEQPGKFTSSYYHGVDGEHGYSHWHYKLRQARNSCPEFFDILNNPKGG